MPDDATPPRAHSLTPEAQRGYREMRKLYDFHGHLCRDCAVAAAECIHHLDGHPQHNGPENVTFLCLACHRRRHNFPEAMSSARARSGLARAVAAAAEKRRARTHCVKGHPLDALNTYWIPGKPGYRGCKACRADAQRKRRYPAPLLLDTPNGRFAQMRLPGVSQTAPEQASR